jgi:23S rRNA (uracil1939-C5)-methyltransferase
LSAVSGDTAGDDAAGDDAAGDDAAGGDAAAAKSRDLTEQTATVSGLTHEGEGVVHGGKTVFVAGALPGERIRFRRTRRHRQHDDGALLEVLEPAPTRVRPRCPHFGVCGGCALQHLASSAQVAAKSAELRDTLARVARVAPATWLEPLTGPEWGYRRRARLGAKFVRKKGCVVVGFRERAAPYVAQLSSCDVLAPPAGALIAPLAAALTGLSIREHVPQIEVAVADNATALVLRVLRNPTPEDLAQLTAFAAEHGVRLYLQPGGLDSVRQLGAPGEPLRYALPQFRLELEFAPTEFVQVNGAVNQALVARAVQLLALTPQSVVLDLFCGLGNFTLALARSAARVVGVEGEPALVERARGNAERNRLSNASFHVADLAQQLAAGLTWMRERYSHVLLDPPRTGAREALAAIAASNPQRVLYISCHPGSLARDLGVLVHEHGFTLAAAGVVDMFPHTAHVESLALLTGERRGRAVPLT